MSESYSFVIYFFPYSVVLYFLNQANSFQMKLLWVFPKIRNFSGKSARCCKVLNFYLQRNLQLTRVHELIFTISQFTES